MWRNQRKIIDVAFVSGISFLLLASYMAVFKPQMQRLVLLHSQERTLQEQLNLRTQVRVNLDHARSRVDEIEQRLAAFDRQLPTEAQLDTYLKHIDQAAKRTGFDVTLIKPGVISHEGLYSQLPIVIEAESPFPKFYSFLSELYDTQRLTKIDALTITRKHQSNVCDIALTLLIYTAKATDESSED